jgi:arginine-tRNA-protein transferase
MSQHSLDTPQFYLTNENNCPYIEGKQERKVFTYLVGEHAQSLNDNLTQGGFRRSQNIAYRPACVNCKACVSIRILVNDFNPSSSMRRVTKRNQNLYTRSVTSGLTDEHYKLFRHYIDHRHYDGGMADMNDSDFEAMVNGTYVNSKFIEYRLREGDLENRNSEGELIASALIDEVSNGLSMVYSYFNPEYEKQSIGTYMILDHIRQSRARGLPYLYLGYWIEQSPKMAYKRRFQPQEHLSSKGWIRDGIN